MNKSQRRQRKADRKRRRQENGSYASPGFDRPEGIVCFHLAGNVGFKMTIEKDDQPKSWAKKK